MTIYIHNEQEQIRKYRKLAYSIEYGTEEIIILPRTVFTRRLDLSVWYNSGYYVIDYAKQRCHIEGYTCY